jgi:hypothetical protein
VTVCSAFWTEIVALMAAFVIAVLATNAGISGAVLLLPFQASELRRLRQVVNESASWAHRADIVRVGVSHDRITRAPGRHRTAAGGSGSPRRSAPGSVRRPLPWSAFPGEPPAVDQVPGAGQQRRHAEPEQQGVLEPGRAAAAGGGGRGGERAGAGGRAVDRFPPPAVVVLTDDLCAVFRHTGRAMI